MKAGFEWQIINDERYLVYRENFCQITYVHGLSAYVIEATNNRREAENGVLEDGELYPDDMPEQELFKNTGGRYPGTLPHAVLSKQIVFNKNRGISK